MDITIHPRLLRGDIAVIPSKSQAHRYLICAAFADRPTQLHCPQTNRDMEATADCLRALGADIVRTDSGYTVFPISGVPETAVLNCCESGSTLRFFLPIVGALGVDATFLMEGRLPSRPLSPLWEEMERMGCTLTHPTANSIRCTGKLQPGEYSINGSVSSQFITGLLFAHALMEGCSLNITGTLESKPQPRLHPGRRRLEQRRFLGCSHGAGLSHFRYRIIPSLHAGRPGGCGYFTGSITMHANCFRPGYSGSGAHFSGCRSSQAWREIYGYSSASPERK